MLWLGIVQAILFAILSVANFALAYRMYKIQRGRNTPKLVITGDEIIKVEDHEAYALRVYNVGLVPAVGVRLLVDVEDWKNGKELTTKFREQFFAYTDNVVQLNPQDFLEYELPNLEDRSCIITAVTTCANGTGDDTRFMMAGIEPDPNRFSAGPGTEEIVNRAPAISGATNRPSVLDWRKQFEGPRRDGKIG